LKLAFTNFKPTPKANALLQRTRCEIVQPPEAHILLTKLESLAVLESLPTNGSLSVLFAPSELIKNEKLQHFLSSSKNIIFVCAFENWEDHLACTLPAVFACLNQANQMSHLSEKIEQLAHQFQEDVELAAKIHHQLLPSSDLSLPGISVTSKYLPAAGLGGDYFDVFELDDKKHLGILMADSQTHGMAAALLSTLLKTRLDDFKQEGSFCQHLMTHLNQELYQIHQSKLPGLDLVFGLLDRKTLAFEYVSAGSLKPLIWNYPHFQELPNPGNPALGISPNQEYETEIFQLRPGDLLFFHTNGLEAVFGETGNPLRLHLANLFTSIKKMNPLDFQTELMAQINRFQETNRELPDDITLIQLLIDKKTLYLTQSK